MRVAIALAWTGSVLAQTTQGLIGGSVVDARTGKPVIGAHVSCVSRATKLSFTAQTGSNGFFVLPLLSPGVYKLRVSSETYQAQEVHELELNVAGRIDVSFLLRPLSDVWEAGQYRNVLLPGRRTIVTFYGPDIDPSRSGSFDANQNRRSALESSVSQVVDPAQIMDLPLAGRDVYTMLVTQPGINADTTTARSLGLSSNGQRPSASNFLLDGLENNNYLVTGPLTAIAPEAIQEYRVSTNNFSAEYGRTSGYLANAITRSGTNVWHGTGYFNGKNELLNANDFQSNLAGHRRTPLRESQAGLWSGGPLRQNVSFASGSVDYLRSRSRLPPAAYRVPTAQGLSLALPGTLADQLLSKFAPLQYAAGDAPNGIVQFAAPVSVDRWLGLARADHIFRGGLHRLTSRFAVSRHARPDFVWTPYTDFASGLTQQTNSLAVAILATPSPALTNELRGGATWDELRLDRPHPEIPILSSLDGTALPSSPVFSVINNESVSREFIDNIVWARGRHVVKAGGGILFRQFGGQLTAGADGQYGFQNLRAFLQDDAIFFRVPLDRTALPNLQIPDFSRRYRSIQYYFFLQDTLRATQRLSINYGVRYEAYGAPRNVGPVKDAVVELGAGTSLAERIATARVVLPGNGSQSIYDADHNDWAGRVGFSYNLNARGATVLRGGAGTYYDRPFDNLWQNVRNNRFVLPTAFTLTAPIDYLAAPAAVLPAFEGREVRAIFPEASAKDQSVRTPLTFFQPRLRSAYTQSFFLSVAQEISASLSVEVSTLASIGRKLVTTDIVNRGLNPALPAMSYRANQGSSNYNAMTAILRHRGRFAQIQAAYTWSHTIDNQSEILRNDYFDLNPTRLTSGATRVDISAFSRQFDSRADRGNSDFDQRHNFVVVSIFDLPYPRTASWYRHLLRGWKVSDLAAFRSGVPFSVFALNPAQHAVLNNRADLTGTAAEIRAPVPGGQRLLDASAFMRPTDGQLGNTGRNAFRGPGFYNIDLSLARVFRTPLLGEVGRITLRADAFNALNHANLNQPDARLGTLTFGTARYGRVAPESGLPILSPVNDSARQIQLVLRIEF